MTAIQIFDCKELKVQTNEQGFSKLVVENALASCEVYLHGATVTSFIPRGEKDLLWLSPTVVFRPDKGIRGGIPICWPWFGNHPTDSSKPAHGFARNSQWQLACAETLEDGTTELVLALSESEKTLALWPYKFDLHYHITIGSNLQVALKVTNTNDCPIEWTGALHTYFAVGDIAQALIIQEQVSDFSDKISNRLCRGSASTAISGWTDRIYHQCGNTCELHDSQNERVIAIDKSGSDSTIVWNPWMEQSATMADMPDDGYKQMLCIEAGQTESSILAGSRQHSLVQRMSLKSR